MLRGAPFLIMVSGPYEEALMTRGTTLMFAVLPLLFACGEEEEEEDNSTNTVNNSSGGTGGAGGTMGAGGTVGSGGSGGADGTATNGAGGSICERGCEATLEADCENGPQDMEECVTDCENLGIGECGEEYAEFQACADGETITCQAGIPVVEACSSEQTDFIACINQ